MAEENIQSFELQMDFTQCAKNHTYHPMTWPTTGTIAISKCERQCRFPACKAWSQTAAALRKASALRSPSWILHLYSIARECSYLKQ